MKRFFQLMAILFPLFFISTLVQSQENHLIQFNGTTDAENGITIMSPGFGSLPLAEVSYGNIPTDHAFDGATDGRGMMITAAPGTGAIILTSPISMNNCALLRCSVRASAPHVSIYLASIDLGENVYVSTITANNPMSFVEQYGRIADFFLPPSIGFQGLLQVVNTSETETVIFCIDNFEILDAGREILQMSIDEIVAGTIQTIPTDTPTSTATHTPIPTPTLPTPTWISTPTTIQTAPPTPTQPSGDHERTITLSNLETGAKALEFIRVPAGYFMMGSPETEKDRSEGETLHKVTHTKDIYMGKFEVTQGQWLAVMGSIPKEQYSSNSDLPIQFVTWTQILSFIEELNKLNLGTFRLPTDAEWEYACRAGTSTRFYWGDDLNDSIIDQYAWYYDNAKAPNPVGSKIPNAWGLYDMSGNVWEFCSDWYEPSTADEHIDPKGPSEGIYRLIRGGSWANDPMDCRSALRQSININNNPDFSAGHMGFRLIMEADGAPTPTPTQPPIATFTPKPTLTLIDDALYSCQFSDVTDLYDWYILNGDAGLSEDSVVLNGLDNIGEINHKFSYTTTGYLVEWEMTFPSESNAETWGGFSVYTDAAIGSQHYGLTDFNEIFITISRNGLIGIFLYGKDNSTDTIDYWMITQTQITTWNPVSHKNRFRLEIHPNRWILLVNNQIIEMIDSDEIFTLESVSLIAGINSLVNFHSVRIAKLIHSLSKVTASDGAVLEYPVTSDSVEMRVQWDIHSNPLGQDDPENKAVSQQYRLEIQGGTLQENISLAIPVHIDLLPKNYDPALLSLQEYNPSKNQWEAVEYFNDFDPETNIFYISLPIRNIPPNAPQAKTSSGINTVTPYQGTEIVKDYRISYSILYSTNAITFDGSNFTIHYNPLTVKKDTAWTSVGSGDYGTLAVPDYIEDMDKALNLALSNLLQIKDSNGQVLFADPTNGGTEQIDVYVKNLGQVDGNTSFGGPIRISENIIRNWNQLKTTVAHEMVHFFQGDYYGLKGYFQWFATRGNQWFVEASAQYYGAMAAELTENEKGAFYADNPEEYLLVPITSNEETSYYTAGHFLEWIETKLYPGIPIVANTLMNRSSGVDIENLHNAMLADSPAEAGKAAGSFDTYCHYLLTSPDDMGKFGSLIKSKIDFKASALLSANPFLTNTQTFITYTKDIPHLSAGYAYLNINNSDSALLVVQAEQPEVNGVHILQNYLYTPRGMNNSDYSQLNPQLNFSTFSIENAGKNEEINSLEFMIVNPQIRLDSSSTLTFYLLRPPVVTSVNSNQVIWSTEGIGTIPKDYIKGYKIYRNGSLLNYELTPYVSGQQTYSHNLIQPGDSITVAVIDQFDHEWPKPTQPTEPSPTPTVTSTPTATATPTETHAPTVTPIYILQDTPTPTIAAVPTPTLKPDEIVVTGRITDYSGTNGLEGITVRFHPYTNILNPVVVVTDASGYYSVVLTRNTKYNIVVVKEGYRSNEHFGITFSDTNSYFNDSYSMIPRN